MSMIFPIMLREVIRPMRMIENQMRLMQEEIMNPQFIPTVFRSPFFNQRPLIFPEAGDASFTSEKDMFQVKMDVQHFNPEEIKVKMEDNTVIIEAKHEEKPTDDKGFISRHMVRRFSVPEGHDLKQLVSYLSSDGILTITAPKNLDVAERVIPIIQTGPEKASDEKKSEIESK